MQLVERASEDGGPRPWFDFRWSVALGDQQLDDAQFRKLVQDPQRRHTAWFYIGQISENREDIPAALDAYRHVDRGEHHVNAQIRTAAGVRRTGDMKNPQT